MSTARVGTAIGTLAAGLLGAVLLVAAYAKAIDPGLFALQLRDLLPIPPGSAHGLAVAIVGFEAALGTALLSGWRRPVILLLANGTFLVFLAVVVWHLLRPGDLGASCGCFGQLLERTPAQAFLEDLGFVGLSGLAWLGRPPVIRPTAAWQRALLVLGLCAGIGLAYAAPGLPLDDHATALGPGVSVAATHLDQAIPELTTGRHLVVLLDRADPAASALVAHLNQELRLPGGPTAVWGVADDDPDLAASFLWSAGPAFDIRSAPPRMLRTLYRTLPRTALIDAGRVVRTWSGLPPGSALAALSRGDLP